MRIAAGEIAESTQSAEELLYAELRAFKSSADFAKQNNLTSWVRTYDNVGPREILLDIAEGGDVANPNSYKAKVVALNGGQPVTDQQLQNVIDRFNSSP